MYKKLLAMAFSACLIFSVVGCSGSNAGSGASDKGGASQQAEAAKYSQMSGEELDKIEGDNKAKEKYLVIDVRSADEYRAGHLRHAINIPVEDIDKHIPELKARGEEMIVTYCNTGKKSAVAAEKLAAAGLKVANAAGVKDYQYKNIVTYANELGDQIVPQMNPDEYTIIDARDQKDYDAGHVKGAIHMDSKNIDESKVPKDKPVITYCYSGNRSGVIADKLSKDGYKVTNAIDGTKEYKGYVLDAK